MASDLDKKRDELKKKIWPGQVHTIRHEATFSEGWDAAVKELGKKYESNMRIAMAIADLQDKEIGETLNHLQKAHEERDAYRTQCEKLAEALKYYTELLDNVGCVVAQEALAAHEQAMKEIE